MIINCEKVLKDLSGNDIFEKKDVKFTIGKALGNIVVDGREGGKMKLYTLGTKLYSGKKVEVDESDLEMIKRIVETSESYNALILGQCSEYLGTLKGKK